MKLEQRIANMPKDLREAFAENFRGKIELSTLKKQNSYLIATFGAVGICCGMLVDYWLVGSPFLESALSNPLEIIPGPLLIITGAVTIKKQLKNAEKFDLESQEFTEQGKMYLEA